MFTRVWWMPAATVPGAVKSTCAAMGVAPQEGTMVTSLAPVSTAGLDPGHYPDREKINAVCSMLARRDGRDLEDIQRELTQRQELYLPGGRQGQAVAMPATSSTAP